MYHWRWARVWREVLTEVLANQKSLNDRAINPQNKPSGSALLTEAQNNGRTRKLAKITIAKTKP